MRLAENLLDDVFQNELVEIDISTTDNIGKTADAQRAVGLTDIGAD